MDTQQIALIFGLLIVPGIGLLGALMYLRKLGGRNDFQRYYEVTLLGHRFVATRSAMLQALVLGVLFWWLDWFLPFSFALIVAIVGLLSLAKTRELKSENSRDETQALLEKLSGMQGEISAVKDHVAVLGRNVAIAQSELETKEAAKAALERLIEQKADEAKGWQQMTEAQRNAYLEVAVSAMAKESRGTFWWGLLLGFVINLVASLTWALMGNPGKDEILQKIERVGAFISLDSRRSGAANPSQK
jgi:hypothetical protein